MFSLLAVRQYVTISFPPSQRVTVLTLLATFDSNDKYALHPLRSLNICAVSLDVWEAVTFFFYGPLLLSRTTFKLSASVISIILCSAQMVVFITLANI